MVVRSFCAAAVFLLSVSVKAQTADVVSGLDEARFETCWQVESESPDYKVTFFGDTCEISAPLGLTLWRKEKMEGDIAIEYDACVMDEGKPGDRLSDLNCFWMASDPKEKDIWTRMKWRTGNFSKTYSLQLYYVGYGGNHNSILKEYTDKPHLLTANKWYHIKLQNTGGRVRYYIDGELLVDYRDPNPLTEGWFGFRTTESRVRIANFKYE